jgi:hypothetical protein
MVSYVSDGIRHTVEVEADGLFEAAAKGINLLKQHGCPPSDVTELEVEVRTSIVHTLQVCRLKRWLEGAARSPNEKVLKERLKALIA